MKADEELLEIIPEHHSPPTPGSTLSYDERRMLNKMEERQQQRNYNRQIGRRYPIEQLQKEDHYRCDHYQSRISNYDERLRKGCRSRQCEHYRDRKLYYYDKIYRECR